MVSVLPYLDCYMFYGGACAICGVALTLSCVICKLYMMDAPVAALAVYHSIGSHGIYRFAVMAATDAAQAGYHS